jgi:hypothetical protein
VAKWTLGPGASIPAAIIVVVIGAVACTPPPTPIRTVEGDMARPIGELRTGAARVYVIDDAGAPNSWIIYNVIVDGRGVCALRGGRYAVFDIEAGHHRFVLDGIRTPYDFETPANHSTYLRLFVPPRTDAEIRPMPEADARAVVQHLQRVDTLIGTGGS